MALYDPKEFPNEVETTADFTLADVLAWARTKPADERYCYIKSGHCAVAQFLSDTGRAIEPGVDPWSWADRSVDPNIRHALPDFIDDLVRSDLDDTDSSTFGALAARLEQELAQ